MYYGDDSFDTQINSDEFTPEYEPTDQDYRDMAEAWAEEMDGDHASGLASAGWGTDEDYGDYGCDFDF